MGNKDYSYFVGKKKKNKGKENLSSQGQDLVQIQAGIGC
jgi:hypothetical protein